MSREACVNDEPGGEVAERGRVHIKAETDWSEWAGGVKQEPAEEPADSPLSDTADAPCTARCAGYCRRGALHDHTYATPGAGGALADECGKRKVGPARAWSALYAAHAVKDELVLGPERVQHPPAAPRECFNPRESPAASERALAAEPKPARKPRGRLALKECSARLERAPPRGPRARPRGSDRARGDEDSEHETCEYAAVDYEKDPTCDICGRRFAAKSDLVNHVAVHIHVEEESDDLPQYLWRWAQLAPRDCRVRLERCAVTASAPERPPALGSAPPRGHVASRAPRGKRANALHAANTYVCDICEGTFRRKRSLIRHVKMHTEKYESPNMSRVIHKRNYAANGRYFCKCKKEFKMLKNLLIHIRIRKGGKAYSCAICKKRFLLRTELKSHTLIHTREQPFSCVICKRKFRQLSSLKRHKSIIHSECDIQKSISESAKVKCEICNKRFADLKTHKLVHTGEKPYSCEVCGKGFTQSSTLTAHGRIHTGEKPYPCKMCKRRFRRLNDLYRHNRIHTGEMPYPCEICGEQFRRLYWLTDHLRYHTGEKQIRKVGRPRKRSASPLSNCGRRKRDIRPRERPRKSVDCARDDIHREDVQDDVNMNEEVTNMYVHISGKGERQRWRRVEANLSSSSLS